MNQHENHMKAAFTEGETGMRSNEGGPFGAVIVKEQRIIARAHNEVIKRNDPTAHAEILAIRRAAAALGRFSLHDCAIYSTCEPCPMCLSAIIWARIPQLHYGCTQTDAAHIGFDDSHIYDYIRGSNDSFSLEIHRDFRDLCLPLFNMWSAKKDRTEY